MAKFVLVGAGSLQFGTGMLGDIFQSQVLTDAEVVLNDIDEAAARRTLAAAEAYIAGHRLKHRVRVEMDLGKALPGADFVVISIEVGDRFALWDMDWRIPQQYGIPQVYGENGGPGGLFHSLRIIPPILEICRKVMEHAPGALVFNFSNPMSRICAAAHRAFPGLRLVGMCHEISSLEHCLPKILDQPRANIRYRAGGLNHFSVMTECRYADSGRDAYPDVRARAPAYFAAARGYSEALEAKRESGRAPETESWAKPDLGHLRQSRTWSDRWLFRDVLERFGALPITTDSHFGEYIQWAHDCADHRGIVDFYTYYRHLLRDSAPRIDGRLRERIVPIVETILTGRSHEEPAVNVPNAGFIEDLPAWIAVEVPATVDARGVTGIGVDVPAGVRGLLSNQVGIHNLTAEAVLRQSRDLVVQALLVDPVTVVSKRIPELVDHMIAEQRPWLDYLH